MENFSMALKTPYSVLPFKENVDELLKLGHQEIYISEIVLLWHKCLSVSSPQDQKEGLQQDHSVHVLT